MTSDCDAPATPGRPLAPAPGPGFLFWSERPRRAFPVLEYGVVSRAPVTMLTGGVEAGETPLVDAMQRRLDADPRVELVSSAQGDGARRVVLIFDEARSLNSRGLEELRMFTNINADEDEPVQLVLVGWPELRDMLAEPATCQIAQRMAARFNRGAADTAAFIACRLRIVSGAVGGIAASAARAVHESARGALRLISQRCDPAMLHARAEGRKVVGGAMIAHVIEDVIDVGTGSAPAQEAVSAR